MRRSVPLPAALPPDIKLMNAVAGALGLVFAVMGLALVLAWLMHRPMFSLKAIQVQGDLVHNNAVTLRANVAPKLAGNFFTVDLTRARAAFESVPWVRQAVVRRQFPNRLQVVLQEHQAMAYWGPEEDSRFLNTLGEVFEVNQGDVEANGLPLLNGPAGQAALVLQSYQLLAPLFEKFDTPLTQLELTGRGSWRARLESGAALELGQGIPAEIHARVQRFVATVAQTSSKFGRDLESADLRYSNGYALKLRGVTTVGLGDKADKK